MKNSIERPTAQLVDQLFPNGMSEQIKQLLSGCINAQVIGRAKRCAIQPLPPQPAHIVERALHSEFLSMQVFGNKQGRPTRKITSYEELFRIKSREESESVMFNLGLNFRRSIVNYAMLEAGDWQHWDDVLIKVKFLTPKKKLFEAVFTVYFAKNCAVVKTVRGIRLTQYTYTPYIARFKMYAQLGEQHG